MCISTLNDGLKVPFVVTKQNLSTPVIGFNIIERLVKIHLDSDYINPILNSVFWHLNSIKTEVLVNLVQQKNNQSNFVGTVQNFWKFSISKNSVKTDNIGATCLQVLLTKLYLNTDLIVTKTFLRINTKRIKTIKISTNKDIKLQIIARQVELISVAVPQEIKQSKLPESNEIKICEDSSS